MNRTHLPAGLDGAHSSAPADSTFSGPDALDGPDILSDGEFTAESRSRGVEFPEPPEGGTPYEFPAESKDGEPQAMSGEGCNLSHKEPTPSAGNSGSENHGAGCLRASQPTTSGSTCASQISQIDLQKGNDRLRILRAVMPYWNDTPLVELAAATGVSAATLCRLKQQFGHLALEELSVEVLQGNTRVCGRKPGQLPNDAERACVQEYFSRIDESAARGRGLGSSKIAAYRLAAKSEDPRISELFKAFVLKRRSKRLPESWLRLLQTSAAVLDYGRDKRSTMSKWISTPRSRMIVNAEGEEVPLQCGTILEADDGTLNFYCYIPWPFGGDPCSEKFGVKLGRWQLLVVVDVKSEMCVTFDVVSRNAGSYRGEDSGALLGRTMLEELMPDLWRLERGSWESKFVRDALALSGVPCINAWHSKQKSAVERFFDRLWTPASVIPGHVGRDRGRYKQVTDLAGKCQAGSRDPRDHFLSLEAAMPKIIQAIQFANTEPIESRSGWGTWVPQDRWENHLANNAVPRLDSAMRIFFSREQRVWTVRKACLGGSVEGPLIKFPIYFQCPELAMFEGCKLKCYFDPYADNVTGTLVLQHDWREHKANTVIATNVPALDLPPQAVLAEDWAGEAEHAKSLAVRKAISKSVRSEYCNWAGKRTTEARDGLGNTARRENSVGGGSPSPRPSPPGEGERKAAEAARLQRQRSRLAGQSQMANSLRRANDDLTVMS